ncbi:MAG: AraC family transcriptional regulator [Planctomycetota bacterium]
MLHRKVLRGIPLRARGEASQGLVVDGVRIPKLLSVAPPRRQTVEYVLDRLHQESFGNEGDRQTMCVALLTQLLLEIKRSVVGEERWTGPRISPFARETIECLCEEVAAELASPWSMSKLVKRSGYSATQLASFFVQVTGMSPCRWIAQARVRKACELLAQSDASIVDIAVNVGFGSRCHFHRVFHKVVGTTPGRYRSLALHETRPLNPRHAP